MFRNILMSMVDGLIYLLQSLFFAVTSDDDLYPFQPARFLSLPMLVLNGMFWTRDQFTLTQLPCLLSSISKNRTQRVYGLRKIFPLQ